MLPLWVSKVGASPMFSTFNPCCTMKSSTATPLVFVSGPYRELCAFVSMPKIAGYFLFSIIFIRSSSHLGCTSFFMSMYTLAITVCFPFIAIRATAQSLLHHLSMDVMLTSELAMMPALGGFRRFVPLS